MHRVWHDHVLFWQEFRRNFHTTGAALPSGPALARELASQIGQTGQPQHVLEAGPGTGAVTRQIVEVLGPHDRLDVVELNPRFVELLRHRFAHDPGFSRVSLQTRVLEHPVQHLLNVADDPAHRGYDRIVSGLPLNNFSTSLVEEILVTFRRLLRPGGVLSFFEYVAVRRFKKLVSARDERVRLQSLDRILGELCSHHEFSRRAIWGNVPPAWVHHLRFAEAATSDGVASSV